MSVVPYLYSTLSIPDLGNKLMDLENKLRIDLDLRPYFLDCIYDMENFNIVVNFNETLSQFLYDTLTNICQIILYDGVVPVNVYNFNYNNFNRRSFYVSDVPSNNHDLKSGYSVGSIVTTTINEIYICTNNSLASAVWQKLIVEIPPATPVVLTTPVGGTEEISKSATKSTGFVGAPMYLNYTQKDGKGLEVVSNSMFFSNNDEWQNLGCFTTGENYTNITLITYHKKGGKIRIIETKSNKIIAESEDMVGDMIKTQRRININGTLMYTIQGKQTGTGIHSLQLF
jgi:hypothetical protein